MALCTPKINVWIVSGSRTKYREGAKNVPLYEEVTGKEIMLKWKGQVVNGHDYRKITAVDDEWRRKQKK